MANPGLTSEQIQEAVDVVAAHKYNITQAARALGISRQALQNRLTRAEEASVEKPKAASKKPALTLESLKDQVKLLQTELKFREREHLDAEYVKRKIIGLTEETVEPPDWAVRPSKGFSGPGVPTLFASDWHWGEIVDKNQIGGVNEYRLSIAQDRARLLVERTIDICFNHIKMPSYPGIVFALGGDMVSGDIHDELSATNEEEIMPVLLDLFGVLIWCIEALKEAFGKVFLPCVGGNHGRNTHKIRMKGRNFTSFDWLLYQFLAKHFEGDEDIKFMIPDGSDCNYAVMGHRYLLTHGDQFRGGDGMIGALGPIIRGDHRKRSRNAQIGMDYDTMICGHWHQLIQLQRLIVNGSLKGYDEYAFQCNFGFEVPRQALWITHPTQGITFSAPVNVTRDKETKNKVKAAKWVSWNEGVPA